ncbi:MAG TPA: hypothetical protein VFR13_03460 [Jiangellaceae bacterium]|nr:hypothetical protein [Jiangellaceae bacterium]
MPRARVDRAAWPSRRAVLVGAAAVSLTACTGNVSPPADDPPPPEPDAVLRGRVVGAERALLALYAATAARHPSLSERLLPFAVRHGRHLAVVETSGPTAPPEPSISAPTASPGRTDGSPTPEPVQTPDVVADLTTAVAVLRAAERAAADDRIADCLDSEDGVLAELLAAVAACEAAHEVLLGQQA